MKQKGAIFFYIASLLILITGLGGCMKEEPMQTAGEAVKIAFDGLLLRDKDTVDKYFDYHTVVDYDENSDVSRSRYYEVVLKDLSYTIKESQEDGGRATVTVDITNRDLEAAYDQFVVQSYELVLKEAYKTDGTKMNDEELKAAMDEQLLKVLENADVPMRTTTVVLDLIRNENRWFIDINETVKNAMYGGLLDAIAKADKNLNDASVDDLEKEYQAKIDETEHKLRNAAYFLVEDLWNNCLCNIVSYINAGTDVNGEEYDINGGIEQLGTLLKDEQEYGAFIESLDDAAYENVKSNWQAAMDAAAALYGQLQESVPDAVAYDYTLDTTAFETAMESFNQAVYPESTERSETSDSGSETESTGESLESAKEE